MIDPDHAPALSVQNLVVEYPFDDGHYTAVNDISFEIFPGEMLAIVGESGSGKSATALSVMRLIERGGGRISEGSILLNTSVPIDIAKAKEHQMERIRGAHISMIFQEPLSSLNPSMTAGNQVVEVIRRHLRLKEREAREVCLALLQEMGISNPEECFVKYPHQYSGGQKQRIMLASALAANPQLLIADEPTTALDAQVKHTINELLDRLRAQRKLAVMYITHDIESIIGRADRVLVMFAGKVVEQGKTADVVNNPKHPYTKGLLACRPPKTGRFYFLPTINDFMRMSVDGLGVEEAGNLGDIFKKLKVSDADRIASLDLMQQAKPILKVNNLSKSYTRKRFFERHKHSAIRDVSFELKKGESLGLVGASGCGKTTLGRCIVGLTAADSGSIELLGHDGRYIDRPQLGLIGRKIQYVFQDPYSSLDPKQSIGKTLLEPLNANHYGKPKERLGMVMEMLLNVGLKPDHFHRLPSEFSGGQRQRIAIARAVLLQPEILICDEAVSALDVSVQAQVLNLLNELKHSYQLSFLFISHDLDVVRYMCDRILVMKDGQIVEEAEADALFERPQHYYTRELIKMR